MNPVQQPTSRPDASQGSAKARESLSITDNRTGKSYEVPIKDGAIRATDLRQIKSGVDDFGLMSYDPAFNNTASCISRITYIDGDKGILHYRGYAIEKLAEKSTYPRNCLSDSARRIAHKIPALRLGLPDFASHFHS